MTVEISVQMTFSIQSYLRLNTTISKNIILRHLLLECKYSKSIDFFQNAQYPLIMKQQQQNDAVLKDLFGVSGNQLQELKTAITSLQKGELIIKDQMAFALDIGKKYKKIKVSHLI